MPSLKGPKVKRPNFTLTETVHMIKCARDVLPLSMVEWESIAKLHSVEFGNYGCTGEALNTSLIRR